MEVLDQCQVKKSGCMVMKVTTVSGDQITLRSNTSLEEKETMKFNLE